MQQARDEYGLDGVVNKAKQGGSVKADEKTDCKITLYANGFKVDDGEFREYSDPANAEFMKDIKAGYVPKELQQRTGGKGTSIALEDRRQEEFKKPPPPKEKFGGAAVSLGGAAPTQAAVAGEVNLSNEAHKPRVDESKAKTMVSICFHTGKSVKIELNTDHTVRDIMKYVESVAPVAGEYSLIPGFPPKPLTNLDATVEEAKLMKATIR